MGPFWVQDRNSHLGLLTLDVGRTHAILGKRGPLRWLFGIPRPFQRAMDPNGRFLFFSRHFGASCCCCCCCCLLHVQAHHTALMIRQIKYYIVYLSDPNPKPLKCLPPQCAAFLSMPRHAGRIGQDCTCLFMFLVCPLFPYFPGLPLP